MTETTEPGVVPISELRRVGFHVSEYGHHGWGWVHVSGQGFKGFSSEAKAWKEARVEYGRKRAAASSFLGDHDRRVSELLEANNRYQQAGRDARAVVGQQAIEMDRLRDAAKAVCLAAWTDRHSLLHGHETVRALDKLLTMPRDAPTEAHEAD